MFLCILNNFAHLTTAAVSLAEFAILCLSILNYLEHRHQRCKNNICYKSVKFYNFSTVDRQN